MDQVDNLIATALNEKFITNRRATAVEELGKIHDLRAVEALAKLLDSLNTVTDGEYEGWLSGTATAALSHLGALAIPALIDVMLNDPSPLKRANAATALIYNSAVPNNTSVLETLAPYLNDSDISRRNGIVRILGVVGTPISFKLIVKALEDPNPDIKVTAILLTKKKKIKEALGTLIGLLRNSNDKLVKDHAANAILEIGDRRVVPQLHEILPKLEDDKKLANRVRDIIAKLES